MKKFKIRSYIDTSGEKAMQDLDKFYFEMKKQIEFEASSMPSDMEFKNINFTADTENKNISSLHRFFRGAVLPYYVRQNIENFDVNWKMPKEIHEEYVNRIKTEVGFFIYDSEGKQVDYNSFAVFNETKAFVEKLKEIEEVVFLDQGFIYPSSEHYEELEKQYSRSEAPKVALAELEQEYKNKFKVEEIKKPTPQKVEKSYILLMNQPSLGKEIGDYYNGEFKQSIEELLRLGIIKEEKND